MTAVIRRKIDRARPAATEGAPGADRGWRLALARAARDAMGLELDVARLTVARHSLAELMELAPERALIALLNGPRGGLGAIMLAPEVTATLIEMQTLGRLTSAPPLPRRPTRIDAAMVAGLIDRALAGLDEALAEEADQVWAAGFRYASFVEEVRPLALMLEDEAYRVMTAEIALGGGRRGGKVLLMLPAVGRGELPAIAGAEQAAEAPQFTAALAAQVMQADCRLDAVIGRVRLPLHQIMALAVGELMPLPQAAVETVTLETLEGRRAATGRLGQHRGLRAIKLTETLDLARDGAQRPRQAEAVSTDAENTPDSLRAAG